MNDDAFPAGGASSRRARERQRLSDALDQLEREVDQLTEWRTYVRRQPLLPIALASASGLMLGALSRTALGSGGVPESSIAVGGRAASRSSSRASTYLKSLLIELAAVQIAAAFRSRPVPRQRPQGASASRR